MPLPLCENILAGFSDDLHYSLIYRGGSLGLGKRLWNSLPMGQALHGFPGHNEPPRVTEIDADHQKLPDKLLFARA